MRTAVAVRFDDVLEFIQASVKEMLAARQHTHDRRWNEALSPLQNVEVENLGK